MISSAVLQYNFEQLHLSIFILYDFIEPVDVFRLQQLLGGKRLHHALLFCETTDSFKEKCLMKVQKNIMVLLKIYVFWLPQTELEVIQGLLKKNQLVFLPQMKLETVPKSP